MLKTYIKFIFSKVELSSLYFIEISFKSINLVSFLDYIAARLEWKSFFCLLSLPKRTKKDWERKAEIAAIKKI